MSLIGGILAGVTETVAGLGIALGDDTLPVMELKTRQQETGIETLPAILVYPAEGKDDVIEPMAFAGSGSDAVHWHKIYHVQIEIVAPNNADQSDDSIPTYSSWIDQIQDAFKPPWEAPIIPGVSEVWDVDILAGNFLPPAQIAENYDEMNVLLAVHTAE
jgi:hypothetical protein